MAEQFEVTMELNSDIAIVKFTGSAKNLGLLLTIINQTAVHAGIDIDYITVKHKGNENAIEGA